MSVPSEDGPPSTATASGMRQLGSMTTLRWVYPARDLVTVLADSPVVLGRDPSSGTQLDTTLVSRRHAEVKLVSGTHVITDLDSKNGVFVNAERVSESRLGVGDVLRLGDYVAVVEAVTLDRLAGFRDLGHGILGGAVMGRVLERAKQAAAEAASTLLIHGETGTGKGLLARAIHGYGARSGAFVVFSCTSSSENTLAGELFGQRGGALPGVLHSSIGQIRAAQNGTLVLDEVHYLPLELQATLLRVIERREVLPLGETQAIPIDVRFIAKSQAPLDELPRGRINQDLRQRLESDLIEVPALRERRADIVPLFVDRLRKHGFDERGKLEPELVERLCLLDWPMNVRELDRVARRLVASHADERELTLAHLVEVLPAVGGVLHRSSATREALPRRAPSAYPAEEVAALRAALERHEGNLTKAASELGITRSKAYRMLGNAHSDE